MFFKKLFTKKSHQDYEQQGDVLFAQERYAEARLAFEDAAELLASKTTAADPAHQRIKDKLVATGDQLALLNIREAKFALASGAVQKAEEYLDLAAHFSQDPKINREITEIISGCKLDAAVSLPKPGKHGCATCSPHDAQPVESTLPGIDALSSEEQFELLIGPLPEDLPQRYREIGKEFAQAYLAAHNGDLEGAFGAYNQLHKASPNDIFLYEMAVIKAQGGAIRETERLLRDALTINPVNSLCCLSLVQLYSDQRRFGEARTLLEAMRAQGVMGAQVLLLQGDNALALGNATEAEAFYREALAEKALASMAAERLIPLLEQSGRTQERDFLAKKHCGKGCC